MTVFFRAALNARRSSHDNVARLSVCLSNAWFVTKRKKHYYANILIPHERSFILVLWQEQWMMGDDPFYLQFWAKLTPLERKRRFYFSRYSLEFPTGRYWHAMCMLLPYDCSYMHNGARMSTGLFCIIPCTDSIVKVDLRTVSFDIPPQEVSSVVISVFISVRRTCTRKRSRKPPVATGTGRLCACVKICTVSAPD